MSHALVIDNEIQSVGRLPAAARRLDTGQWVTPPDGVWTQEQAAACGYLPVVTTPRPPNTDTTTWDKTVELVDGLPEEVWTERAYTADELHGQEVQALRTDFDVAQSQLTPDQTNALLAADAPPDGEPWRQPSGAHDAYPLDAITSHAGKLWSSLLTANVHEPGVSGWREEVSDGYPEWVQPTGAHDAYQTGDRVTFEGTCHESLDDNNAHSPAAYPAGWQDIPCP